MQFLKSFEKIAVTENLYRKAVAKALKQNAAKSQAPSSLGKHVEAYNYVTDKLKNRILGEGHRAMKEVFNPAAARPQSQQMKALKHTGIRNKGIDVLESREKELRKKL
jgi:hypothetical protein